MKHKELKMLEIEEYLSTMEKIDHNITTAKELHKLMGGAKITGEYLTWYDFYITSNQKLIEDVDYKVIMDGEANVRAMLEFGELDCILTEYAMLEILGRTENEEVLMIYHYIKKKIMDRDMDMIEFSAKAREDIDNKAGTIDDLQDMLTKTWAINSILIDTTSITDIGLMRHRKSIKTFMKENWLSYKDEAKVKANEEVVENYCRRVGIHPVSTLRVDDGANRYPVYVLKGILVDVANIK